MAVATPWTGFYVNGGIGYGKWAADETLLNPAGACIVCETQVLGGKGWLGTLGAGYDYQFTSRIVAGVFGDVSISSLKGTIQDRLNLVSGEIKETSSWAAGVRAGWLASTSTLGYVNGGYTGARFSGTNMVNMLSGGPTLFSSQAFTASGWFLGGGVETSLAPGWFWRNEYRYSYYGSKNVPDLALGTTFALIPFKPTVQTVTTQIVYKFNGGLPAPAYPAMPAMATNWTGAYANAGFGYGVWSADLSENALGTTTCTVCTTQVLGGKGYLGKIGAGYDWQFAPVWVVGVFGDFDVSSLKGTIQDQPSAIAGSIKQTSAWAAGARFGWLPSPQTMTYVNGGYAGARFSGADMVDVQTASPQHSRRQPSPPAAGSSAAAWKHGFDFFGMLGKGWFWRNEYRYASYGNKTVTETFAGVPFVYVTFKPIVQTVTSSVIFKLN